jgi:hypothetical protein
MPQRCHNDATTIPHDSTPASALGNSQRTPESMPAKMRASTPLTGEDTIKDTGFSTFFSYINPITI